jgi:hypothetical protein
MSIVNPYFLFYLRCSQKLQKLGAAKGAPKEEQFPLLRPSPTRSD